MPMPYSHLVLAKICLESLDLVIGDDDDFYLGALMPDIRYFTGKPRNQYHFKIEKLNHITKSISIPKSFTLGYGIHLLIDELWGTDELRDKYKEYFPAFIRDKLNSKILEVALEIFCLAQRPMTIQLRIQENELTKALGVTESDTLVSAVQALQTYIDQHNLQTGLHIAQASGKYTAERLAQLRQLAHMLDMSPLTQAVAHLLIIPASRRISREIVRGVRARINEIDLENTVNMT